MIGKNILEIIYGAVFKCLYFLHEIHCFSLTFYGLLKVKIINVFYFFTFLLLLVLSAISGITNTPADHIEMTVG